VSVIDIMITNIGLGWTYVIHGGMMLLVIPLVYLAITLGPRYRVKRQRLREEEMTSLNVKEKK